MVTIEEVLPNLFRVEIPLPDNPLKAINSYFVKAERRSLIIDTGMNCEECICALYSALKRVEVSLSRTDFFITHFHPDHLGLVPKLATNRSFVYFNRKDAEFLRHMNTYLSKLPNFARRNGFPENELREALKKHPGYRYGAAGSVEFTILKDGDTIFVGDYLFKCIETPGHTSGHLCLYEPNQKIFLAGDHVLENVTPIISLWLDEGTPLKEYLVSLDKVYDLEVNIVLPGHGGIFKDLRRRVEELKKHHRKRAAEIIKILKKERINAYQIAVKMKWNINHSFWEFPASQKWFAVGETLAHLKYLEEEGIVGRRLESEEIIFEV